MTRNRILGMVAAAVLAGVGAARAEEGASTAPAAPPDRPIMYGLGQLGVGDSLKAANINIFGHIEGSYTYNFSQPADGINYGRSFDFKDEKVLMNQLDLGIERTVDLKKWDIGGRIEMLYGSDSALIHSSGLFDYYDGWGHPQNQLDLVQAYVDVGVPVGNGLRLRMGKTVTPLGYETINPTTNPLYSRSYLFSYAIPFTHTGIMATYALNDNWTVEGGIFRGWEQTFDDNNGSISYHAKVTYTTTDKKLSALLQAVTGPEQANDTGHYRTVIDAILTYAATDRCSIAINADYGWESQVPGLGDSQWYGIAVYPTYVINDYLTFNSRLEWFRDDKGARGLVAGDYYEITAGVAITPFPKDAIGRNLKIRPEIRYDRSSEDVFNDGNDQDQWTAAIEAYFTL